ncbi:MAG TPA: DNA uptake protein [Cyanothece sp. UBA12306]|nr:DNA uptake protein [Cyanothece sp. UBA12306]
MALSAWTKKLNPRRQAISKRIVNDPYYRFRSVEEVKIAVELGIKIEVNQATVDDWLRLPGISIHQARNLVELIKIGVELLCIEDVAVALSIPVQRLKPFASILIFSYNDPESLLTPQQINVNSATVEELQEIPSINLSLVQQIVRNRQEQGYYKDLADLQRRLKLKGSIISELMHYLQF